MLNQVRAGAVWDFLSGPYPGADQRRERGLLFDAALDADRPPREDRPVHPVRAYRRAWTDVATGIRHARGSQGGVCTPGTTKISQPAPPYHIHPWNHYAYNRPLSHTPMCCRLLTSAQFTEKTGNEWPNRASFKPMPGMCTLVEVNFGVFDPAKPLLCASTSAPRAPNPFRPAAPQQGFDFGSVAAWNGPIGAATPQTVPHLGSERASALVF